MGGLLLLAAVRMLMVTKAAEDIKQPAVNIILLLGAALGFAAGLTGLGG